MMMIRNARRAAAEAGVQSRRALKKVERGGVGAARAQSALDRLRVGRVGLGVLGVGSVARPLPRRRRRAHVPVAIACGSRSGARRFRGRELPCARGERRTFVFHIRFRFVDAGVGGASRAAASPAASVAFWRGAPLFLGFGVARGALRRLLLFFLRRLLLQLLGVHRVVRVEAVLGDPVHFSLREHRQVPRGDRLQISSRIRLLNLLGGAEDVRADAIGRGELRRHAR
mmetsp:Transcript_1510/g.6305  ORF Transcript_1510/g.6305 Transcript_1510/m.6305 type:complete len:228 (-) Transcript_1510:2947-3630(-)